MECSGFGWDVFLWKNNVGDKSTFNSFFDFSEIKFKGEDNNEPFRFARVRIMKILERR